MTSNVKNRRCSTEEAVRADRPQVSVVMCAYTGARWSGLSDAIRSVIAQAPDELIVVIDHNDELLSRVQMSFDSATVIASEHQRGLSGARNTGVAHATGDVVVFLDDDACPKPRWLSQLVGAFDDASVVGAGGVALPRWEADVPEWLPPEFLWVVGCSYRGLPQHPVEIRNPIGANMAFRRELLARAGGFTDGIGRVGTTPLGCEETELAIRVVAATGGRILQIPGAEVDHLVPADRACWSYFWRRCWAEGLSKAIVARSVGSDLALQSERAYVIRTLTAGLWRGLADLGQGDIGGLLRSAAIVAGFLITAAGYLRGSISGQATS